MGVLHSSGHKGLLTFVWASKKCSLSEYIINIYSGSPRAAGFYNQFNLFNMVNQLFVLHPADMIEDVKAEFFVREKFPDPCFVTNENGEIKTFSTYSEAKKEADNCQQGSVIIF